MRSFFFKVKLNSFKSFCEVFMSSITVGFEQVLNLSSQAFAMSCQS